MTDEDASSDKVARPSQAVDKVERPALPPQYSFEQLAGGCATIQIVFEGREYCLRRTRAGKLVLNK